jgi:hypothetical protein
MIDYITLDYFHTSYIEFNILLHKSLILYVNYGPTRQGIQRNLHGY